MSTFCHSCGNTLPPAARFCSVCGTVVNGFPPAGFPPPGFNPPGYQPFAPRLLRPIFGRQFAGVCIGFARTYGWDVSLIRILAVVGGIFLFPFVEILYAACWIGIPEEQVGQMPADMPPPPPPQV
jgi:phage shock protein PspC (stress-responsive transcriptional regulator)